MSTIAIPTTADELAEQIADDKLRAQIFGDPDTTEQWLTAYAKAANKDGKLSKQLDAETAATFVGWLKDLGVTGRPDQTELAAIRPKPGATGALRNAAYNPKAVGVAADGVFENLGDFAKTVWHRNSQPDAAKLAKATAIRDAYTSADPSAGGFLIPEEFRSDIMQLALEQSVVRPRATVITMGTKSQSIPYVDSTTNAGSVFGGMVFYWTAEAGAAVATEAKFGEVKLEANKLMGRADVPNELYADAVTLASWLDRALPMGLAFFEDLAFLTGSGGNEPLGAYNSPAVVTVTKETGQPADTVVFENIVKMYSRMLPQSLGSAVWLINQTVLPQLLGLTISVGTGGAPVMLVNVNSGPTMTIFGRPVIVTEKNPAIGDAGDIAFVDFGYYLIGDRQAVSVESSTHAQFTTDTTVIRVIERVDGRPWIQSALTPATGSTTLSPIVKLGAR